MRTNYENKVTCPGCEFQASTQESMLKHLWGYHPGLLSVCPPASEWIKAEICSDCQGRGKVNAAPFSEETQVYFEECGTCKGRGRK